MSPTHVAIAVGIFSVIIAMAIGWLVSRLLPRLLPRPAERLAEAIPRVGEVIERPVLDRVMEALLVPAAGPLASTPGALMSAMGAVGRCHEERAPWAETRAAYERVAATALRVAVAQRGLSNVIPYPYTDAMMALGAELRRAAAKHGYGTERPLAALVEEAGEAAEEIMRGEREAAYAELVQVAAVAVRASTYGDDGAAR